MSENKVLFFFLAFASATLMLFTNGCNGLFVNESKASASYFGQTVYVGIYQDLSKKSLEKDLFTSFAKDNSLKIKWVPFKTTAEASSLFKSKKIDIAFSRTSSLRKNIANVADFSYDDLYLGLFCANQLNKTSLIYIPEIYSYISKSPDFSKKFSSFAQTNTQASVTDLQKLSLKNPNTCFVADNRFYKTNNFSQRHVYRLWKSPKAEPVSWYIRPDKKTLEIVLQTWFQQKIRDNKVTAFWDRYNNRIMNLTSIEKMQFQKDIENSLPQWKHLFTRYSKTYSVPWTLIAAVAYKESKWSADARSYTGVRGLMQLTTQTAKHLGVTDRKNPEQSIRGGSYYLKYLYDKTPSNLVPQERWALALAAYNIGWAHIRDAKVLATELNKNPYRWLDLKKVLPLLMDEKYYLKLNYGYARGEETVDFVDSVLDYYEILNSIYNRPMLATNDF